MFPIVLDISKISILLIGNGDALLKRKKQLEEYGASKLYVCNSSADYLNSGWQDSQVVMVAGVERSLAETIAAQARVQNKLVNVEDVPDLCDFYFTASIKRGDLVIAVSTGGASPTLAKKVRDVIAGSFGAEWDERVRILSDLRKSLKTRGASMKEIIQKTEAYLAEKGWIA